MDEVLQLRLSDGGGARGDVPTEAAAASSAAKRFIPPDCPAVNAVMIVSLQLAHKFNAGAAGEHDLSAGDVARALAQSGRLRPDTFSRGTAQTLELVAFELCGWSLPPCPMLSATTLLSVLLVNMRATHRVELDSEAMFRGLPDLLLASLIHSPKMVRVGALMIRVCGCCAVSVYLEGKISLCTMVSYHQ